MSSKSKSSLPETPNSKASPATPRVRATRGFSKSEHDSPSALQNSRLSGGSADRSPRSVTSKPTVERRTPKLATTPDKPSRLVKGSEVNAQTRLVKGSEVNAQTRIVKGSELNVQTRLVKGSEVNAQTRAVKGTEIQSQLTIVQEDLKKAKEQIASIEKEKAQALDDLKEAQRVAEEVNEKLKEALVAQKRAEDDSEIEKFRALELEQVGIEVAQKNEEERQQELEAVRSQHALDVSALLSTTQELQKVKQELAMTCDAKNQALSHADDATKIAEIHADKVENLSAELARLKAILDSQHEVVSSENGKLVSKLQLEIDFLKQELQEAKSFEEKLAEKEACLREELQKAKSLEEKIVEREASLQLELEKSKGFEDKLVEKEASLKREIEIAKALEEKLVKKEASLKQELEKTKSLEEELIEKKTSLKQEIEKSRGFVEELDEKEGVIEQLNVELEAAKMAESYARSYMEEWKTKVQELEMQVEEAQKLERCASESLESVMKQLEGNHDLLHEAKSEIAALKEKVGLMEMTVGRQKGDLEEAQRHLDVANEEAKEMAAVIESLKSELENVKEEKVRVMNNEKLAASSVQSLLEEKNKLINELESSKEEEEKSKTAMESLASALHEVSAEAREAKEKLLSSQDEHENYEAQIEHLRLVLQGTNEKYETMLGDSKHEANLLANTIEQSKHEFQNFKNEWEQKELHLVSCVEQSEKENASLGEEVNRLVNLLKQAEEEVCASREEGVELKDSLKEVEAEVIYLQETLGETKAESMKMKESLLDKENELQSVIEENEELRSRDSDSLQKIDELSKLLEEAVAQKSKLLEEAMAQKQAEENGKLSGSEKEYDLLPKVAEFSEQNGHGGEDKPETKLPPQKCEEASKENADQDCNDLHADPVQTCASKLENTNGKPKEDVIKEKDNASGGGVEFKMWENCNIEKELSPDRKLEHEYLETDEVDSKVEGGESFDQINGISSIENVDNGGTSPLKQQQLKKKKPLLRKFGNLLKKKSPSNQK